MIPLRLYDTGRVCVPCHHPCSSPNHVLTLPRPSNLLRVGHTPVVSSLARGFCAGPGVDETAVHLELVPCRDARTMASRAHCFYCFECLSASFDGREPPSLDKVEGLYEQYEKSQIPDTRAASEAPSSTEPEDDVADGLNSEDEEDIDGAAEHEGHEEDEDEDEFIAAPRSSPRPQLPSISRLQAATPSSTSSKSSSSTPSILSANSSNSALTNTSSVSSTSNRPSYASRLSVEESYPLFVTWNTISRTSGHKSLRGCIGTFDPLPLATGLHTYALTSAFDDARFSPIPSSLLSALSCSLTLLANFEPCRDAMDWSLGTHGLRISFTYRGRRHGATYLPDVAVEQGWTREETLESLMRKAGWDGGSSHGGVARRLLRGASSRTEQGAGKPWEELGDFRVVRYTGLKASANYADWREWRRWVDEQSGVVLS